MASGEVKLILPLGTCLGIRNTWGNPKIFSRGTTRSKLLFCCLFVVCGDLTVISGWSLAPWSQATPLPRSPRCWNFRGALPSLAQKYFNIALTCSVPSSCSFCTSAGTVSRGPGAYKDGSSEGCWDAHVSLWWTSLLLCSTGRRNLLQMGASWDLKNF